MWNWLNRSSTSSNGLGCGYIIRIGLILVGLLLMNGIIVMVFLQSNEIFSTDLRLKQTLQFVLPVGLIFVEFWLYDVLRQVSRR